MVTIRIPANLRPLVNHFHEVKLESQSTLGALRALCNIHPALVERLFNSAGEIRRTLLVVLNDETIYDLDAPTKAGDEISIVPALAGG